MNHLRLIPVRNEVLFKKGHLRLDPSERTDGKIQSLHYNSDIQALGESTSIITFDRMIKVFSDEYFMMMAFEEARKAAANGEIPIGAVLVHKQQLLAKTHNQTELLNDVTAHAEILAITAASQFLNSKYLKDCTLFVTLEPCPMCAAALRWAQLSKLVYAAEDEKMGYMRYGNSMLHPKTKVEFGLMRNECSELLSHFFKEKRKIKQ